MFDYNIEFAHIYSDQQFNKEHEASIEKLKVVIKDLEKNNKTFNLSVLIDEYNPSKHKLSIDQFVKQLENYGIKIDYVGLESKLGIYKDQTLQEIKPKIQREYVMYIENNNKIPCSMLSVIWYLMRLGYLPAKKDVFYKYSSLKDFPTKKIINILPTYYQEVENKSLKIIQNSRFHDRINDIEYKYFDFERLNKTFLDNKF